MTPIEATVVTLTGPRRLELRRETLDRADLGPTELLCETLVTAISPGTELAAYTGAPPLREGTAYPRVQGYCNVARILAVGAEVRGLSPGDRVLTFTSHRSHFVIRADDVLATLPADADAAQVSCAYLYHLGYNAVLRSDVRAGARVLVIGLGVLGLTSVAMAALAGAEVHAVSDQTHPQGLAREFGAREVFARGQRQALRDALGEGADVVICTTNGWEDWALALEMAGTRGTLAVLGFPGRGRPPGEFNPLDSRYFYAKQLRIEAVGHSPEHADGRGFARFNERTNLRYLVDQIVRGRLRAASLISGRYAGPDIELAYGDLLARKHSPVTYVLQWNRD
jgi:D-arabinose 1-dehydrogenase-like Zn-dependent alcohol dehydrogenase